MRTAIGPAVIRELGGFLASRGEKVMRVPVSAIAAIVICATTLLASPSAPAQTVAEFYRDKQIKFVVSSSVGGGFDTVTRLIARHIQKHMPGNPAFVVQNMAGAGGLRAANFLYSIAPSDGTTIGLFQNTVPLEPLYGNKQASFEANKFQWLGSPNQEFAVFAIWHTVPVNTFEDARTHELVIGAPGSTSSPAFYGRVFAAVFGMKIRTIAGYPGEAEALLAMERRENDGNSSAYWSSLKATHPDWIAEKKIKFLLQYGANPLEDLKSVPFAPDLTTDLTKRQIVEIASAPLVLGRPIAAPPNVPADRISALRTALADTFRDPDYLIDCRNLRLECDEPVAAQNIADGLARAYAASPDVVRQLREIYQTDDAR
jgi:tripartite-type tricarboxylate transporter receptor subunit TctC